MYSRRHPWIILAAACLLLVIAASRILRLSGLGMNPDEIWSVWQTFGTPLQIIQWTPYDWPPGYFLTLGLWRGFTGQHPIILRYLSTLAFVVGSGFLFRVIRKLLGTNAALLVLPAYAAIGYGILLSTEVRGYAILLGLFPAAFWFTIRYFERPALRRALPLALSLAALFYVSVTSLGAWLILGIYALVVCRKAVWHGWLPGLLTVLLTLPEIIAKSQLAIARTEATRGLTLPPLLEALRNMYSGYAGYDYSFLIWGVLTVAATTLIVLRRRTTPQTIAFLLWALGAPILMYILHPLLAFFSLRYAWWIMTGIAIWVAWGLAYLPRRGVFAVTILLTAMMFAPIPMKEYTLNEGLTPLESNLMWLRDHLVTGDVFVTDPTSVKCGAPEEWDYFIRTYFPAGFQFVHNPAGFRRVWYVTADGQQNAALQASVLDGRVPGRFVGPPQCLFRLYEAPPDREGILFENGMRFHGADVIEGERPWSGPLIRREGETIRLRLWWSVDTIPVLDYSINAYLFRSRDSLLVESNSPPQLIYPAGGPQETSRWQPGQYYIEERELKLPYPTAKGTVEIYMVVYFWQNAERVPAPGVDASNALLLHYIRIMSY